MNDVRKQWIAIVFSLSVVAAALPRSAAAEEGQICVTELYCVTLSEPVNVTVSDVDVDGSGHLRPENVQDPAAAAFARAILTQHPVDGIGVVMQVQAQANIAVVVARVLVGVPGSDAVVAVAEDGDEVGQAATPRQRPQVSNAPSDGVLRLVSSKTGLPIEYDADGNIMDPSIRSPASSRFTISISRSHRSACRFVTSGCTGAGSSTSDRSDPAGITDTTSVSSWRTRPRASRRRVGRSTCSPPERGCPARH